jgi:hypothetical protein
LRADGSAIRWVDNSQSTTPAGTFIQISSGGEHACGLRANGFVACWGDLVTPDP